MSNNVLEFFIKMKDLMSSGLTKLAQNSKKVFSSVQSDIDKTVAQNKKLADSFDEVDRKAASGGSGVLAWGKRIAAGIGIAALVAGGAFAKASAQSFADFQKNNASFEVLSGNKGVGRALGGELNELKQNTILGPTVYKNAQTMMGFGITADRVIPSLKMLGEVSMGDADRLASLTLAFSQTNAAGRLMGQDLLQYVNAGFNPLHEISIMTGKSMGDLRKEMEKGAISADMVNQAFQHATDKGGLFHGMLDKMANETISGKLQNLHGKAAALQIAFGERLAPAINSTLDIASKFVVGLKHMIEIPVEKKLQDEITNIRALQAELTSSNTSHERQVELLHQLEQINPNIVKGISEQNIEYSKLAGNINEVTGALQKKIFMETFKKENADTLTSYASAQERYDQGVAYTRSVIGQYAPDLSQRFDLTLAQKQILTAQRLKAAIASGNTHKTVGMQQAGSGGVVTTMTSTEELLQRKLKNSIALANEALDTKYSLAPKVNEINKVIDATTKQMDAVLGVKSMTTAGIKGGGNGGGTTAGTSDAGKSVASGITGGGPRVININGVKFADKIELHAGTMAEGEDMLERKFEEMYLRVLNSGANVQ